MEKRNFPKKYMARWKFEFETSDITYTTRRPKFRVADALKVATRCNRGLLQVRPTVRDASGRRTTIWRHGVHKIHLTPSTVLQCNYYTTTTETSTTSTTMSRSKPLGREIARESGTAIMSEYPLRVGDAKPWIAQHSDGRPECRDPIDGGGRPRDETENRRDAIKRWCVLLVAFTRSTVYTCRRGDDTFFDLPKTYFLLKIDFQKKIILLFVRLRRVEHLIKMLSVQINSNTIETVIVSDRRFGHP